MAQGKSSSQTREAVYRLNFSLYTPRHPGARVESRTWPTGIWVPANTEVAEGQLAGLNVPALEVGGIVEKIQEPRVPCEFCQEHGTKKQKNARYSSRAELEAHYTEDHPGVTSTEEV